MTREAPAGEARPRERDPGRSDSLLPVPPWVHSPSLAPTARGERTRQRIIEAAENLFRFASNYDNIGVAEIARASKTSVGTIYRYFESKDDLLHLVLSNAFWRMYKASRGSWRTEDPASVNVERTTLAYLEAFWEERFFLRLAYRLVATSDPLRETWWSMNRELRGRMRARLEQDQAAAGLMALDPDIMIRALLGMVNSYAAAAFIDEEYGPASRQDIAQVAAVLAQIWFRAVFGQEPADGARPEDPDADL